MLSLSRTFRLVLLVRCLPALREDDDEVVAGAFSLLQRSVSVATSQGAASPPSLRPRRKPPNILYSIQTGEHLVERLSACLGTWASELDKDELQVVGRKARDAAEQGRASWHAAANCADNHDAGPCKDAEALAEAFKTGASWVVLVGDDNYVVPRNFAKVLALMDASTPVVLGIKGCGNCSAGGLCGGGGQVFSHGALESFFGAGREAFLEEAAGEALACGMWGDVANCRIAAKRNVVVNNLDGLHGWHEEGEKLTKSVSSTNPKPLTFHYVKPTEMGMLHHMFQEMNKTVQALQVDRAIGHAAHNASRRTEAEEYRAARDRYVVEEDERRRS